MSLSEEWRLREPNASEWALVIGLSLASIPTWIWATRTLWAWFVAPTLGIDVPSAGQLLGLSLVISLFKGTQVDKRAQNASEWLGLATHWVMVPLIALAVGWAIYTVFC